MTGGKITERGKRDNEKTLGEGLRYKWLGQLNIEGGI